MSKTFGLMLLLMRHRDKWTFLEGITAELLLCNHKYGSKECLDGRIWANYAVNC